MINTKRPNTDDYTQVGFIEAKDNQGNYQNIDHIYDSEGNIVFQQGYLNEYDGADDFSIPAIGKPLIDYTIYGNTFQDGIPTSGNPIMPKSTGERTGNLFASVWEQGAIDATDGQNIVAGTLVRTKDYIPIKPNMTYSFSRSIPNGYMNIRLYRTDKSYIGSGSASKIRLISGTTVANPMGTNTSFCCFEVIDSEAAYIRFNDSSNNTATKWYMVEGEYTQQTMPEFEPYGYKISISSGGNNLLDFEQLKTAPPGTIGTVDAPHLLTLQMKPNTYYTISSNGYGSIDATPADLYRSIYVNRSNGEYSVNRSNPVTVLTDDSGNVKIGFFDDRTNAQQYLNGEAQVWINEGSTPLPYEPYVQQPTLSNIYLGNVQTTRRIKKIKLEVPSAVKSVTGGYQLRFGIYPYNAASYTEARSYCNIAEWDGNNARQGHVASGSNVYITQPIEEWSTVESATEWLSKHDAFIWYVLATPKTAVVNEPLMRIGNYADSVNFSQAGVEIPTLKRPNTTVIDITTSLPPSEVYAKYRGSKTQKYDLFLAANGDSFEAKNGQSLYIGDDA